MNTKVTLYHANWCGHCKNFLPQWNALTNFLEKHNIDYADFEDSKNSDVIEQQNIQAFPTIKISKNNNEYEYNGERTVDAIINELGIQNGGSKSSRFYIKYSN